MYNKEILDELVRQFGEEAVILFCKMESVKNAMLYESVEEDKKHYPEPNEWAFERDWWKNNAERLQESRFANRKTSNIL
jgi:hypothetical protein